VRSNRCFSLVSVNRPSDHTCICSGCPWMRWMRSRR
jgi:hypothetical protein